MDLEPFKNLIKDKCGLYFDESRVARLSDGLCARMSRNGIESQEKYVDLLLRNQDEFNELVNLLTINETYFFREPVHLKLLVDRLIPDMLVNRKNGEKIKIISAGCSTGEEPYSLVMALMEKFGKGIRDSVRVIGADIDTEAVGKAREGLFYGHSFRGFDNDLKEKYFEKLANNLYRIKDVVKENVEFEKLNLLSDTYPDALRGADVIFYRNVSIYFEPETQKNIFRNLAGLLNDNGYLFVSSTETLSHNIGILSLIEMDGSFLYHKKIELALDDRRKSSLTKVEAPKHKHALRETGDFKTKPAVLSYKPDKPAQPIAQKILSSERRSDSHASFDQALSLARDRKYDDALACLDVLILQAPTFIKGYMLKTGILINMKKIEEAEQACLKGIELDSLCLEGYLLLGLTAKIRNDDEMALKRFKEALYIQASCWLAHFYLAEIYIARGENEKACRAYEMASKILRKGGDNDHGLTFFPLSFSVDQIAHLCEHNLEKLKKR